MALLQLRNRFVLRWYRFEWELPWRIQRLLTWTRNMHWYLWNVGRWPYRYVRFRAGWVFARQCEFNLRYDWWPDGSGFRA